VASINEAGNLELQISFCNFKISCEHFRWWKFSLHGMIAAACSKFVIIEIWSHKIDGNSLSLFKKKMLGDLKISDS